MLTRKEREQKIKNLMRLFLDSVRDYEGECGSAIHFDERDSEEFVEIFLESQDAFDYVALVKDPAPGEKCRSHKINHPMDPEEWDCDCIQAINGEPCGIETFKKCEKYPGCLFNGQCKCGKEYDLKKLGN